MKIQEQIDTFGVAAIKVTIEDMLRSYQADLEWFATENEYIFKEYLANNEKDLDWIFNQGGEILRKATGATISALAKTLGICNLWGSHGEGFTYYQNAISILGMVEPFLKNKDKNGWMEYVKSFKGKYE